MIDVLVGLSTTECAERYLALFNNQTFKDFRVLVLSKHLIEGNEFTFDWAWIPERNGAWHPEIMKMRHCCYKNELLLHATSEYVLLWDGWQVPDKNLLEEHMKYLKRGYSVCGYRYESDTDARTWVAGNTIEVSAPDPRDTGTVRICPPQYHYDCNASCRRDDMMAINGYDMRFAGGASGEDVDKGIRLARHGCQFIYNPNAILWHLNHDIWKQAYNTNPRIAAKFNLTHHHDPHAFRDNDLMEDDMLVCYYDCWGMKRWRCKECGEEGVVDTVRLAQLNNDNKVVRAPVGCVELRAFLDDGMEFDFH